MPLDSQVNPHYVCTQDVRSSLKFLGCLDSLELQRHSDQEREMLLKAVKSRSKNENSDQMKLKQRAKEVNTTQIALVTMRLCFAAVDFLVEDRLFTVYYLCRITYLLLVNNYLFFQPIPLGFVGSFTSNFSVHDHVFSHSVRMSIISYFVCETLHFVKYKMLCIA